MERGVDNEVIAAPSTAMGAFEIAVTGTGEKTKLSGIMRLVADAQSSKSRAQLLADRAARLLTWVAIGSALVTLVAWLAVGATIDVAIVRVVTVLVIACPHALGLAVPAGGRHFHCNRRAADGLLVRDRRGLGGSLKLDRGGIRQDWHCTWRVPSSRSPWPTVAASRCCETLCHAGVITIRAPTHAVHIRTRGENRNADRV
ncbi:MAG: hypothetical protein IPK33_13905 [Gemmatimonadetes bacterium]|nr:hypothetical protein [Gemmatimonadota bacterium]